MPDESDAHPTRDARPLRQRARASSDIPAPVLRRAEDLLLDWIGSALAGKGARPVESIERFARQMGPADGPSEVLISRRAHVARSSPRWSTPPRRISPSRTTCTTARCSIPAPSCFRRRSRLRRRSGSSGRDLLDRRRRRLRSRHPRRRISRPLALQGVPHDRHRGHARRGRRDRPAARAVRRRDAARIRLRRHAGRGPVGIPARRRRLEAAAHGESRRRRSARRVSRARRLHRRERASSKARRAWRPACRPTPIRRVSPTAWASAGRSPRRRSSSTRRAATRIRRPTRC